MCSFNSHRNFESESASFKYFWKAIGPDMENDIKYGSHKRSYAQQSEE